MQIIASIPICEHMLGNVVFDIKPLGPACVMPVHKAAYVMMFSLEHSQTAASGFRHQTTLL